MCAEKLFVWLLGLFVLSPPGSFAQEPPRFSEPEVIGQLEAAMLDEISGVAVSRRNPNLLWVHNDGSADKVYALTTNGVLLASFGLDRATSDLEDLDIGPGPAADVDYLYIGDIGSNEASRNKVRVYRVAEPDVDSAWAAEPWSGDFEGVDRIELLYPEAEEHNAEGLMIDPPSGDLFVLTKMDPGTRVFRAPAASLRAEEEATMEFVGAIDLAETSAASISPDGRMIAIRREDAALLWFRDPGQPVAEAMQAIPFTLPVVGPPDEANGETISFLADGSGYITASEGEGESIFLFKILPSERPAPAFAGLPQWEAGRWRIAIQGRIGAMVELQRSTNLQEWTTIQTVVLEQEVTVVEDESAVLSFYRLAVME